MNFFTMMALLLLILVGVGTILYYVPQPTENYWNESIPPPQFKPIPLAFALVTLGTALLAVFALLICPYHDNEGDKI